MPTYEDDNLIRPQHVGFGRRLMARAERLVRESCASCADGDAGLGMESRETEGSCDIRCGCQTVLRKPGVPPGRRGRVHGETSQRALGKYISCWG